MPRLPLKPFMGGGSRSDARTAPLLPDPINNEQMQTVVRENSATLLAEIIEDHDAARERIDRALRELHAAHDDARNAYAVGLTLTAAAGDMLANRLLREPASVETVVRENGLDALLPSDVTVRTAA